MRKLGLGDYDAWKSSEPDLECVADDSTECDCPSCEERRDAWEADQGWDDRDEHSDDPEAENAEGGGPTT